MCPEAAPRSVGSTPAPRRSPLCREKPRRSGALLFPCEATPGLLLPQTSARTGDPRAARHHQAVAFPRILRRHFQVLQLRLCPLLRRTGVMQRRSVSSFCLRSCALPWGDSVAELIVQLLSARVGKTRTGSLEHSGPVWQSERKFHGSSASALGLCAASSVARMEPWKRKRRMAGLASPFEEGLPMRSVKEEDRPLDSIEAWAKDSRRAAAQT